MQLPLPSHLREYEVTSAVADEKDVDGFGAINIGELAKRGGRPLFTPCTPKGVMVLLESTGVDLKGKNAVVVGRSDIVGSPVSYLLNNADCTVTVCHSKTQDLPSIVLQQIEHFFTHYKDLEAEKWVRVGKWGDAEDAKRIVTEAIERASLSA